MNTYLIQIFSFGIIAFLIGMLIIPYFIEFLVKFKLGKQIREEATIGKAIEFFALHKTKTGTPTMGGAMILGLTFFMVIVSIIFQKLGYINNSLWDRGETYLSIFTLFSIGSLGLIDDYINVKGNGRTKGMSVKLKLFGLIVFALLGALWFYYKLDWQFRSLNLAIINDLHIGIWFIPFFILVLVATSNSVNITDGLDGLAGGLLLFCYSVYAYITYDQGLYLLSTLCITITGALGAFLWYNVKPAKFYMGDVGSLALGANLGIMAMITNTIFILFIVGAIFIFETLSVIIQITSKKLRKGKKVFRIAPFHHHLEAIGWKEENIVFRFRLIGIVLAVIGVIFYNLQKTPIL